MNNSLLFLFSPHTKTLLAAGYFVNIFFYFCCFCCCCYCLLFLTKKNNNKKQSFAAAAIVVLFIVVGSHLLLLCFLPDKTNTVQSAHSLSRPPWCSILTTKTAVILFFPHTIMHHIWIRGQHCLCLVAVQRERRIARTLSGGRARVCKNNCHNNNDDGRH